MGGRPLHSSSTQQTPTSSFGNLPNPYSSSPSPHPGFASSPVPEPPPYEYKNNSWGPPGVPQVVETRNSYDEAPQTRLRSMSNTDHLLGAQAASSMGPAMMAFPEPQLTVPQSLPGANLQRASSATAAAPNRHNHYAENFRRPTHPQPLERGEPKASPPIPPAKLLHTTSAASLQSNLTSNSYTRNPDQYQDALASPVESSFSLDQEEKDKAPARDLSHLSQDMEESIARFQRGELADAEEEWHRLVPEEAMKALENKEIQRQGMIFELFKAEREYVSDLQLMEDIFIHGLFKAQPPVIPEHQISAFVNDVFGNLHEILLHHRTMLGALFARQRDDHPLINSIADVVLETALKPEFRDAYEKYIKHYPMAESIHQKQRQLNPAYEAFLESVSSEPRIKKRDLKIFLSRPVTRLPRLNLLLESILKKTDKEHDHPDLDTLPLALGILGDCIKATQPGIEAAESRVKFMDICEHLVAPKGEIMDLDLFDKERHLVHVGPVWTKAKADTGFMGEKWQELQGLVLDNYFILYREKATQNSTVVKKIVQHRPVPLSFIRLASFNSDPEIRKEKNEGLLGTWRSQEVSMYPFTFYHSSPSAMKAYKMYVTNEAARKKWYSVFVDALGVHKVKQENNPWFTQEQLSDGFFRIPKEAVISPHSRAATGKITSAVPFNTSGGRFIAIACTSGIYIARYGTEDYRKVFNFPNATYIAALQVWNGHYLNKFIIHFESTVLGYSLDLVAMIAYGQGNPQLLEASRERITPSDQSVMFVRHISMQDRVLLIYAAKKRLSSSCYVYALEPVAQQMMQGIQGTSPPCTFRPYGQPGGIPKDTYDVVSLTRTVAVCTRDGLITADPSNLNAHPPAIPLLNDAASNQSIANLKANIEGLKPLGFLRVSSDEIMVIYDDIGCYVNTRGYPARNGGYIRWETKVTSYAHRNEHLFLVSPRFIEIRLISNGRLLQVIEGGDIRLLFASPALSPHDNVLVAMRGRYNDPFGLSEKVVELMKAEEYSTTASPMWSEWDM
ncbi:hypothetical protein FA15DRAFT_665628 [Coprinopsis marcescibilis]|uniref:Signal transducer n=1 Tax=Coprinopsis marcescibilis TaxID=230819 RepID=A0A5C3L681_COPMA|nr:hypothetical protein FA15DRAFT_665628 [Coprinopsis marcescibilis]